MGISPEAESGIGALDMMAAVMVVTEQGAGCVEMLCAVLSRVAVQMRIMDGRILL